VSGNVSTSDDYELPSGRRNSADVARELGILEVRDAPLVLPKSERLTNQLCGLERRVARSGKDSIDHGPGSHDDIANSVAGAADLASGRRDHPPAQFGVYGYYVRENKPHRWDGPVEDGGFATSR
jgi:hypothetical protein